MSVWIALLNGVAVSLFGSVLAASFCDGFHTRRGRQIFWCSVILILLLQGWSYSTWNVEIMRRIYPLVTHLPLVLVLYIISRKLLWSAVSVLTAYLCCQLRRWVALLVVALVSGGSVLQGIVELIVTIPLLLFLLHFVTPAVRRLIAHPPKFQCRFGTIPAIYYVFDYAAMVYTDLLTSGSPVAVEFMPFVCCVGYLVFLLYHSAEEQKQNQLQQVQKSLDIQLRQSAREISALRESQTLARQYRHDLRHHLQYVSACIENGQSEQAQEYISGIDREIEAQKVQCYCENEAANLIFSAFDARAKKDGIVMNVKGVLPAFMMISNSDLCVILSNALENAIHACQAVAADGGKPVIDIQAYEREGKLFLQMANPCKGEVRFEQGIPVSDRPDHGIGVQSICAIVQKYGGVYTFLVKDNQFILRLSI